MVERVAGEEEAVSAGGPRESPFTAICIHTYFYVCCEDVQQRQKNQPCTFLLRSFGKQLHYSIYLAVHRYLRRTSLLVNVKFMHEMIATL